MAHVTFIHGIANKPPKDQLIDIWIRSLARNDGPDLDAEGVTYSMVYWADVLYERPDDGSSAHESLESQTEGVPEGEAEDESWRQDLPEAERQFLDGLTSTLGYEEPAPGGDDGYEPPKPRESDPEANRFERIPVPWFIKRRLMKVLLRDVHHYLFNTVYSPRPGERFRVRDEIRRRFVAAVAEGASKPGPHIVLSHSMGTVIAYDCLKRVGNCAAVDALMTVGSPLGLDEIQDKLGEAPDPRWTRQDGFPSAKVQGSWVNVYDRLDPVCGFDPKLANDYERASQEIVRDLNEQNYGKWRHSIDKYLGQPKLQAALSDLLF